MTHIILCSFKKSVMALKMHVVGLMDAKYPLTVCSEVGSSEPYGPEHNSESKPLLSSSVIKHKIQTSRYVFAAGSALVEPDTVIGFVHLLCRLFLYQPALTDLSELHMLFTG